MSVSSPGHIKEFLAVPDSVFSLYAASRQLLQPRFTMHNFNWLDKEGTKGGNEGGGFVRAVRVCLTSNLQISCHPSASSCVRSWIVFFLSRSLRMVGTMKH